MTGPSPSSRRPPSPRPSSTSCPSPSTFTRLYEEQLALREETRRRLAGELEQQLSQECPFKPTITPYPGGRRHDGTPRNPFARLSQEKGEAEQYLEAERARQRAKELEECSFHPKTNPTSPLRDRSPTQQGADRQERRQQRRQAEEEDEAKAWFKPQINPLSRATAEAEPRPPLHERVEYLQRNREVLLHHLRQEEIRREAATFRPTLNPTSAEIVSLSLQQRSVSDDGGSGEAAEEGPFVSRARAKGQEEAERRHARECTFRPTLAPQSAALLQLHAAFKGPRGFHERQTLYARRAKSKLQAAAQKAEREQPTPFRPALSPTSVLLAQAKRDAETDEQRVARLAKGDREAVAAARKARADKHYAQFSFRPNLNPTSRSLAKNLDTPDVTRAKTGHVAEELRREMEEEFRRTCTFQPAVSAGGPARAPGGPDVSALSLAGDPAERERRLAEARREKQYEELKECTFQPQVPRRTPRTKGASPEVPGMAAYLERRQQAKALEDDRRTREEEAFKVKGTGRPGGRYTVPEPFHLHADRSAVRRETREAQAKAQATRDCPFAPATNSRAAYDLLRRYVMEDDPDSDPEADDEPLPWAHAAALPSRPLCPSSDAWEEDVG